MKWVETAFSRLEEKFGSRPFAASTASKVLCNIEGYHIGSAYRILFELEKEGKLEKLGRGVYRIPREISSKSPAKPPEFVKRLAKELRGSGINGQITGFPVLSGFTNLIPRRVIYLLYVPLGAGESAAYFFGGKLGKIPLLNPTPNEIKAALDATEKKDLIVVREMRLIFKDDSMIASTEKALVDLYFEASRKKIPLPLSEVGQIFGDVLAGTKIDMKELLRAASRRGIRKEIEAILFSLRPEFNISGLHPKIAENAKIVLNAARGI
ncbi:MAG: DUF6577 family protein [Candidatus Micrarchaeota archaeon]